MKKLINFLYEHFGCKHDWELLQKGEFTMYEGCKPYRVVFLYRCKKCGKEKKYEMA